MNYSTHNDKFREKGWVRVTVGKERQPPAGHNEFAQISNDSTAVEMRP